MMHCWDRGRREDDTFARLKKVGEQVLLGHYNKATGYIVMNISCS